MEMPDRAEAQLAKERGRFTEGPLHYVPKGVIDANGIYYGPEKDHKFRLLHDCSKGPYNPPRLKTVGRKSEAVASNNASAWCALQARESDGMPPDGLPRPAHRQD